MSFRQGKIEPPIAIEVRQNRRPAHCAQLREGITGSLFKRAVSAPEHHYHSALAGRSKVGSNEILVPIAVEIPDGYPLNDA
jgi:hypothetical protein